MFRCFELKRVAWNIFCCSYIYYFCRLDSFSLKCSFTNTDVCDSVSDDEVDEFSASPSSAPVVHLKSECLDAEGLDLLGGSFVSFVDTILTALPVSFVLSHTIPICETPSSQDFSNYTLLYWLDFSLGIYRFCQKRSRIPLLQLLLIQLGSMVSFLLWEST